jgi:endonuclease/exonuclease/phosphatase family metal-dependent hydrolase
MQLNLWLVVTLVGIISMFGYVVNARTVDSGLVVATYNIRYYTEKDGDNAWPKRKARLVKELMSHQPAIIGMQEVLHSQLTDLQVLLPGHFAYVGVGRNDGETQGEYAPLWYDTTLFGLVNKGHFWLNEEPGMAVPGWDAHLPRICTWAILTDRKNNKKLLVMNTHFDHAGSMARTYSADLVVQVAGQLRQGIPLLFMGDLNCAPTEYPHQIFGGAGWLDARNTAAILSGPTGTFPDFDGQRPEKRIDYVYYQGLDAPLTYHVDGPPDRKPPFASDHLPVIVKFRW